MPGFFDDDKDDESLTFSYFIEKFSGLDTQDQKDILKYANAAALGAVFDRINKGLSGTESIGLIDDLYLVLQKYKQQSNTIRSPLWLKFYDVFDKLSAKLKDYNYKLTYFDIVALINLTDMLQLPLGSRNRLMLQLDKDNLIDETFFDNLETYLSIEDMTSENVNKCIRLTLGIKDYTEKFMTKISPKLFADKTKIAEIILDLTTVVSVIKDLRKKNIIPEYYPYLASYAIDNSRNSTPLNKVFFKSLMLIDDSEVYPFIKEVIDGFQLNNNEDILSTFFYNLIGSSVVNDSNISDDITEILGYTIPTLVNIYSIKYSDVFSFLENNKDIDLYIKAILLLSILKNGTNPNKDEVEIITKKYYENFLSYAFSKNLITYDPEIYTYYVKLNQGKDLHNDPNFKKWVQDWYIPHSKLKDDSFFTFSEQEQACYLNEPEKYKVENTSLGTVSVDVLKYNINNIDGREFAYIYKYKDQQSIPPEFQDIITRRKETLNFTLNFTNSEITDYHTELRSLEAYKKYIEKQALFISSLSLYEYGIVFSHFTGMFQYSTNYIKNRGNVDTSLPIYSCLFELIIGVCLENGIDIGIKDLQEGMTLSEIFYTKLSGKKNNNMDKTEIKDLALNISKKFMERYYVEFNKIFEKAPEVEDDLVIYRGVRDVYWNNNISKGEFSALNIQSTTLIPHLPGNPYDIISNYTDASSEKDTTSCCLKRILLKKGCRSIFIQLMEPIKRPLNQVILPSYSKYIVKEVHDKLMIKDLKKNQACNTQKDFIKTFDMEVIQTPSYPSVEDVVSKFSSHFKDWMYDPNSHWIVKGGYGLKKVMEIRYNKKDVIKTDDIDISVLFTKNDEDKIKNYKDKLIKEFNDFAYSTGVPYLFSYIEPRYIGEKELKWICQFSYAGREWIDISLVYYTSGKLEVDKDVSEKVGLPVKTIVGYAKDYKEILREENIRGIDDRTYQKRNPKTGFLAMKGRKDIQRTKELCFIEEVEKEFPTLCSFLKLSAVRVFMNLPENELKKLLK